MTTKQKAKAYDEALERARKIHSEIVNNELLGFPGQIEDIFPQLRESEDERIIKKLQEYVKNRNWPLNGPTQAEVLAWLEKQKNLISYYEEKLDRCACENLDKGIKEVLNHPEEYGLEKQKEQQQFISCDSIGAAILSALASGIDTDDILKVRGFTYEDVEKYLISVEQKEQKSAEVDESTKRINKNWMKQYFDEQKQEYPLTPDECIKPTEWSEIEVEFRGEKVKVKRPFFRDDKGRGYSTTEQDDEVTWNALRAWAESHGHTPFDLYPKEEWSEEDEEMRDNIICILHKDVTYMPPTGLNSCAGSGNAFYTHQTEIDWLKSLRPQSHWKPTEEQMKCLLNAEGLLRTDRRLAMAQKLTDLYEHLKKL